MTRKFLLLLRCSLIPTGRNGQARSSTPDTVEVTQSSLWVVSTDRVDTLARDDTDEVPQLNKALFRVGVSMPCGRRAAVPYDWLPAAGWCPKNLLRSSRTELPSLNRSSSAASSSKEDEAIPISGRVFLEQFTQCGGLGNVSHHAHCYRNAHKED